ncbi:MAG: XdhC family protein [Halanaeroarchaeum sp.]
MIDDWGAPVSAVLPRAHRLLSDDRAAAIATLVDVDGSAYRRPGAKLLVSGDGDGTGAVAPGCLEREVTRLIESVIEGGRPRLESFDLRMDDDSIGLGVGCDGRVELLIEPLDETYSRALSAYASRDRGALLSVIEGASDVSVGDRGWYQEERGFEDIRGPWPDWVRHRVTDTARRLARNGGGETIRIERPEGAVRVFIDGIVPPPRLLVIGTGNDVSPVVTIGSLAGFDVDVVGYRSEFADEDTFPTAATIHSTSPSTLRNAIDVGEDTYCVVMTHNFVDDRLTVEELLETPSPYIGVVSSRDRSENLIEAIEGGSALRTTDRRRVYAPVGLDLGGGSPGQIALSTVSEVVAVHNEREPGHLRDRTEPIHHRND